MWRAAANVCKKKTLRVAVSAGFETKPKQHDGRSTVKLFFFLFSIASTLCLFSSNILYIASSSRFLYSSFSIQIRLRILTVISNEVSAVGVQPSCQRNLRVACEAPGGLGHRAAGRLLASGAVAVQSEHDRLAGDTAVEGKSLASQKCS